MKHLALYISFLLALVSTTVAAQEIWDTNTSPTATHKSYGGLGIDMQLSGNSGSVFSIAPEYGRILGKYVSMGVSGKYTWYATPGDAGTSFGVHPYVRINTSFPKYFPNLFVDIGYDFSRRSYEDKTLAPSYHHDFGVRPGIIIDVSGWFYIFIQFSFSGYQWSLADGISSGSWTFFRHDYQDRCAGVYFYF